MPAFDLQLPTLTLPIIVAWMLAWCLIRRYAVVVAVLVASVIVAATTAIPADAFDLLRPKLIFIQPVFDLLPALGIAVPLFIVTMASQNVPGVAVLRTSGYEAPVGHVFVSTGIGSIATAVFGGHGLNLSAITAALCAGPEAGPDPERRYLASVAAGFAYLVLGPLAGFAAAFIVASPPLLIQAVAGLALLSSLAASLTTAMERESHRLAALITFITAASGISLLGVGAVFWALLAGALPLLLEKGVDAINGRRHNP